LIFPFFFAVISEFTKTGSLATGPTATSFASPF
jgi:hypothetical protein